MDLPKYAPLLALVLCVTILGLFGSGDLASTALNLLYLLIGSRLRF